MNGGISWWRRLLRAAKAARARKCAGRREAARAAAFELTGATREIQMKAATLFVSLQAKGLLCIDLWMFHHTVEQLRPPQPARRSLRPPTTRTDQLRVEQARQTDIVEIIQRLGFRLVRAGRGHAMLCPFHDDHRPSLYVASGKGWFCFVCGIGGDAIGFVRRLKNLTFAEAVREVTS